MKSCHLLIVVLIAISSFFCADIVAELCLAASTNLPSIQIRNRPAQLGKGEAGRAFTDYSVIPRRNLFGLKSDPVRTAPPKKAVVRSPKVKRVASVPRPVRKPKAAPRLEPLKLKLKGTISGDSSWARAIVNDIATSEEVLLKLGDKIQGAELKEIKLNEIVLVRGTHKYILKLGEDNKVEQVAPPKIKARRKPKPSRRVSEVRQQTNNQKSQKEETVLEKEGLGERVDDWNWVMDRQAVLNRLNNVGDLINQVSVMPYFDNGRVEGFRVSNIAPDSLFEDLGAQEGDIIEEVNGIQLSNVNQVMSLFSELQVAPELRVRVKRGQSYQFLVYNLQ